jgi:hypothetical protein
MAVITWAALIAAVFLWGYVLRRLGHMPDDRLPPLHAAGRLPSWQLLPAAGVAAGAVMALPVLVRRLRWRPLLAAAWAVAAGWAVALAAADGATGFTRPLTAPGEYFAGLGDVRAGLGPWLRTFTETLTTYPTHVAGHPPLPMVVLWALDRIGFAGPGWAAASLIAAGSSAVVAIAVTVKVVAGAAAARRALPFLVLAPFAVWVATSMDALFLGVGAWATALLALAAAPPHGRDPTPRGALASVVARCKIAPGKGSATAALSMSLAFGSGLLLGALPYLSYGLLPLFAVPAAVLVLTRPRWPVIAVLVAGGTVVPLLFTLAGFWWPDGVAATYDAYLITGGSYRRSYSYFLIGDLAVLGLMVGPAVAAAFPRLLREGRQSVAGLAVVVGAALVGVAALDLSGVTRGEVERIWLPYAGWVLAAAALHRLPARRWLAGQALIGLALQGLTMSNW